MGIIKTLKDYDGAEIYPRNYALGSYRLDGETTVEESLSDIEIALDGFSVRFVTEIPTEETTEPMTIYLIPEEAINKG